MNIIPCSSIADGVRLADGTEIAMPGIQGEAKHFGIRPEHIRVVDKGEAMLTGTVGVAEHLGGDSFVYVDIEGMEPVNVRIAGGAEVKEDDVVGLAFDLDDAHLFGADELRVAVE